MRLAQAGLAIAALWTSAGVLSAQDVAAPEALAIRAASPGYSFNEESNDYTAIELELQTCTIVQTLLTTQGQAMGDPVGIQVLRMDLRDLDPITGILPAEDTVSGNRRLTLVPSQAAWGEIQTAGGIFSEMRTAATEAGDQENINAPTGARTLRTIAHRAFSADAASGVYGPVMARTHVMQMRGDRGPLIYPLVAPMQINLSADGFDAAMAAIDALRAGDCAPEGTVLPDVAEEDVAEGTPGVTSEN